MEMKEEDEWNLKDLEIAIQKLLQELKKFRPNLNILLVGYSGSGKSSFIRTLKTLFDKKLWTTRDIPVATQITKEQTTKHYKAYKLDNYVSLWDTQGFTELTSNKNEYLEKWIAMIEGRVPDGTEFSKIDVNARSDKKRRIDLIIFLLSPKEGSYEMFKPVYNLALKRNIKSVFAASKLDQIVLNLRSCSHMDCCYEGSQTNEYDEIHASFEKTDIEENLYIVYNYDFTNNYFRNINNEYTVYKLIEEGTKGFIEEAVENNPFEVYVPHTSIRVMYAQSFVV